MRLFIDANILVTVCNQEYPLFPLASRILSLSERKIVLLYTSPLALGIAFYFAEKKYGKQRAKQKIYRLAENIRLTDNTSDDVKNIAENDTILDFEDGLQYYSALRHKCNYIITEDVGDYHFSAIPVFSSEAFLLHLLK